MYWQRLSLQVVEGFQAVVLSKLAQLVFDTKQLVVLRNTVSTGRCTSFDLASVSCNRDISDCAIFGLTGTVGDNVIFSIINKFITKKHGSDFVLLNLSNCINITITFLK
ncbi:hypothetical protein SAMN04488542_13648 [Fontibacillus panacisegetis]|uniref:Uncharacterized protein n=1 Tax=Fontibacillus panacisegetis TaxID=670482 RepID=A0A1G7TEH4_9BACL|nr:hypothetical protein SAMN04488542_13648 [Fontibacillus panacisegetis]